MSTPTPLTDSVSEYPEVWLRYFAGTDFPAEPQSAGAIISLTDMDGAAPGIGGCVIEVTFDICAITTGSYLSFTAKDQNGNIWGPNGYPPWTYAPTTFYGSPQIMVIPAGFLGSVSAYIPVTWPNMQGIAFAGSANNDYPGYPVASFPTLMASMQKIDVALYLGASDVVRISEITVYGAWIAALQVTV